MVLYCPSKCTATGSLRLRAGGGRSLARAFRASPAAARAPRPASLCRADLQRIVRAGRGTLSAKVSIADLYGSHEQTLAVAVHPAPLV
ncbi:MAG: hypothetical protein R2736_02405 [Solirubrobacterales bacterium]